MNRRLALFAGLFGLFLLLVCGSVGGVYLYARSSLENVYITLDKMSISSQSPSGGGNPLDMLVRGLSSEVLVDSSILVDNRNALGATVESIDYRVRVNGRDVGEGRGPEGGTKDIAANSKTVLVTRTKMPVASLMTAGAETLARGEAKIDIVGKAKVSVLFVTVERDFQFSPKKIEGSRLDQVLGGSQGGKK
jgi:LEA14-like dessication related protein